MLKFEFSYCNFDLKFSYWLSSFFKFSSVPPNKLHMLCWEMANGSYIVFFF